MLTPQDVRSVQFEKNLRGYRTEDVDRFLDKVEEQLQQNDAQAEQLRKQIADLTAENQKLKGELQSFEADGDMLKSALINAQRMGENVIREANQKAEEIIHRANRRYHPRCQRAAAEGKRPRRRDRERGQRKASG